MRKYLAPLVTALVLTFGAMPAHADGLRVAPVLLEVTAPGAATTLTLRNEGNLPITVQSRVFHWTQVDGLEYHQPTQDVVVSPPITQLAPGTTQTVRVVRTSRAPVQGEEAYRIYVDELPNRTQRQGGTVSFATRMRIPLFFVQPGATLPAVTWSLRRSSDYVLLEAQNSGNVRLRLSDLTLARGGSPVAQQNGLVGYVLGNSVMRWSLGPASRIGGTGLNLRADTNRGALQADVPYR